MDSLKPKPETAHLLDDLQSIRDLLEEDLLPPLLTETLSADDIPLLSEIVPLDDEEEDEPPPAALPLRLKQSLHAEAQLILQEVVDDFVPQIEAELKRRLEARLERLLALHKP
ncbi:DNA polymerase III subunit chi [Azotobacter chroococcum]|uniref:DNA polymerase III subunit chi n=1 Tax=Azotobacter chroococcum TaxID=353 RepID=A0AA43Z3V3_9GAMM|nr:DNA polymerase III subunit chi [Azotobacter chroococcum]NHN76125.1 DNA polymerase III subunit chi [Azotobacter chroococcum]